MTVSFVPPSMEPNQTRRGFLEKACWAAGCGACAFGAVPSAVYLASAGVEEPKGPQPPIPYDDVPVGSAKVFSFGKNKWVSRKVLVYRSGEEEFNAMDARCTHLGCIVEWDETAKQIRCNCHGGLFDKKGKRESGPPPTDLPLVDVKPTDGHIIVTL